MDIERKDQDNATVLSLCGRLGFDEASSAQSAIEDAIADCRERVIVDCGLLEYVSSAGLRAFLVGAKAAEARGVGFSACALDQNVESVFTISGFDRIVPLFATLDDALAG